MTQEVSVDEAKNPSVPSERLPKTDSLKADSSCAEMIACGVDDDDPSQTMRHAKECPAYSARSKATVTLDVDQWMFIPDENGNLDIYEGQVRVARACSMAYGHQIVSDHNSPGPSQAEVERLKGAIQKTLDENGHLADGEICTLIHLKRAIGVK